MKEFIEKLIGRLEEIYNRNDKAKKEAYEEQDWERFGFFTHRNEGIYIAISIVNQLADEYEECFNLCSENCEVYDKEKHYCPKWCKVIRETVEELKEEYFKNAMIDGQYCFQTCGATEHCKECNRLGNGSIDYYENYDFMSEEHNDGWIPCSERLPDKEGTYLVTLKKWETITFARFTDIKTNPHFNALVIAWMPLPQPYTEEQKELSTTWQQQTMRKFERVE